MSVAAAVIGFMLDDCTEFLRAISSPLYLLYRGAVVYASESG